ncbi:restriction endonuclease subunit S [Merdimonas faecis]|uniref:restriction endonuclease subunit S n=1 Tax=Merdimonas faecis TaxID=1653435 RepID=UPI0009F72382|nr:restriction endonuclease subunit S [Merdimonas faecis]
MVNGWIECPITEVLRPNGIKIGPFGSQLKKEMLLSDGVYRVYGQENVYEHDFNLGDRFLTREHFNRLKSCEILPGDFVMSTMGTIGKCAIVPSTIQRGIMDSHLIRLRFDEKKVRSDYILQLFSDQFHYLSDQTARLAVGGIMDGLSVGIVSRLNVVYPESVEEQGEIIKILSEVDKLLIDLKKLIRKKKNIRQGTMQMLVTGKRRLDGFTEDWVKINLAKNSRLKARIGWQGLTTAEYLDEGYSYLITGTDFKVGRINWNGCHYVDYYRYEQDPNIQVSNGDLLLTKDGTIGKVAYVSDLTRPATLNSGVFLIKPITDAYTSHFMFYVLESSVFKDFLQQLSAGSTINHLYQKDLVKFDLYVPPTKEEQESIADILSDMDSDILKLEEKLSKYQKIKQGMMEELLTGKVRLM